MSQQFSRKDGQAIKALLTNPNASNVSKIKQIVESGDPSERSLLVRYSVARQMLSKHTLDKDLLNMLLPPRDISDKVAKENNIKRDDQKRINVTKHFIKKIIDLQNTNNLYELSLFLLLNTGRRTQELITGRFYSKRNDPLLYLDGVLKRSHTPNGHGFPTLKKKTVVLRLIRKLQKTIKHKSDFNFDTYRRELLRYTKRILGSVVHPHMLRGIYANYLYKFRNTDNLKINSFIKSVLSHETVQASLSYTQFHLLFDDDFIK
jgi:integrase